MDRHCRVLAGLPLKSKSLVWRGQFGYDEKILSPSTTVNLFHPPLNPSTVLSPRFKAQTPAAKLSRALT